LPASSVPGEREHAIAALVSRASQTECRRDDGDLERSPSAARVRIGWSYGSTTSAETRSVGTDVLEPRWLGRHLAVRCDDCRLAVAVAVSAVVSDLDMRSEVLDHELARCMVELALVVSTLDQLLEGDVGLFDPRVLGGRERDVAWEQDRRIEEHE
jgi:hypothetical protein